MVCAAMKIHVTQEDIDLGVRQDCNQCPICLALRKHFKDVNGVWVDGTRIIVSYSEGKKESVEMVAVPPRSVSRFVGRVDQGKKVKPFNFILK